MNQVAATQLIGQTFDSAFDEQAFENFIANLLNQVNRSKSFGYRSGNIIPQAFREHISTYRRPFVYYDPAGERMDVLVVRLSKSRGLERTRTMQRNFAAWYLKQDHAETVEAALIAFYHEDVSDWRFSFVQLEYTFGDEGAEEKLTPARRYSFLVGPTEPTHTAESQLRPFLIEDGTNPAIADLAAAFQIETVSQQFFEEYKELFLKLVEGIETALKKDKLLAADFKRAEIHLPNFAKKLLGQIVFLYFVQKKGWLGVALGAQWGSGSKDFLRRLYDKKDGVTYSNFFNDVLEPLFYEALAIKRAGDAYSIEGYTCQIPFLNGGLFEPMGGYDWQHTRLLLPNTLFSNRKSENDVQATGILDVFGRYNFTVREEEPLEKEVAVDPEMLGKVFQNLLEVQDRKSKGAFYTPREIVHYMCQESLINYLDTSVNLVESGLAEEKPVQASMFGGAKPQQKAMRTLTRVERVPREDIAVLVRQGALALQQDAAKEAGLKSGDYVLPQTVRDHARELDVALATIKVCDPAIGSGAFPVGMLHEIVQARQALGTYLGEPNRQPYSLKYHAIQESIYGVDIDAGAVEIAKLRLWLSLVVDEENYDDIQPLPNLDYKIVCGNSLLRVEKDLFNNRFFVKLDELKQKYFKETHRQEKLKLKTQIEQLIELLTGQRNIFDFEVYFHEVFVEQGGFDVVIGNPPYLNFKMYSTEEREIYKKLFPVIYDGKADVLYFFLFKALNLVAKNGYVDFIVSRYWLEAEFAAKLRNYIVRNASIESIIDFGNTHIFEGQGIKSCIIAMINRIPSNNQFDHFSSNKRKYQSMKRENFDVIEIQQSQFSKNGRWIFYSPKAIRILEKVEAYGVRLDKIADCKQGIVTGRDAAFVVLSRTDFGDAPSSIVKPWIKVGDVFRYAIYPQKIRYLAYTNLLDAIEPYPRFLKRLEKYKHKLANRREAKNGKIRWFDLQWPRKPKYFEEAKLVCRYKAPHNTFAYDDQGQYSSADTTIVILKDKYKGKFDAKYLLAVLNSKLLDFYFKSYAKCMDYRYEYYPTPVGLMYIVQPNVSQQQRVIQIVDELLDSIAEQNYVEDSSVFEILNSHERQLNGIVYQLCNLTDEEIQIVENAYGDATSL